MLTRREVIAKGLFTMWMANSISLFSCLGSKTAPSEREEIRIRWHVPRDEMPVIREKLYFEGEVKPDMDSASDTKGLPTMFLLVGVVLLRHLVDSIIALYRGVRGGIVIKIKDDEVIITNDSRLPGNVILIIDKNGAELKRIDREPIPQELIDILSIKR
jgi:hypothetical protein